MGEGGKRVPVRRCMVTRRVREKGDLLRFVASDRGEVVADMEGKLSGRGCWVELCREHMLTAVKRQVFARALGDGVRVGDDLVTRVEGCLRDTALKAVKVARNAGVLIVGDVCVRAAARRGELACVVLSRGGLVGWVPGVLDEESTRGCEAIVLEERDREEGVGVLEDALGGVPAGIIRKGPGGDSARKVGRFVKFAGGFREYR